MKFQILMSPRNVTAAYFVELPASELDELIELGFHFVREFEADSQDEARKCFASWCKDWSDRHKEMASVDFLDLLPK